LDMAREIVVFWDLGVFISGTHGTSHRTGRFHSVSTSFLGLRAMHFASVLTFVGKVFRVGVGSVSRCLNVQERMAKAVTVTVNMTRFSVYLVDK
jgi:hypothetical protein